MTSFVTPRPMNHVKQPKVSSSAYSVYEPLTFHETPGEIVYVTRIQNKEPYPEYVSSGLSSSKSATHINYARQVYM